ncbi:MAG: hypothetical protein C7B46_20365 [Sulfobacillus benefaciens]|uniref:AB hydrolase-1 domain-containing protein n=1 Tax=Sulfobacillus benefaciens TaxID=453960 RepID=A0A2T2WUV9_9FIRM|nr:MAG: hypothetical protein C7B46_20365 [Sulfobacillus benefaciens]
MKDVEDIIVGTSDGARIETYYLSQGPLAVLLCHGKAFDRDSFIEYGKTLAHKGYSVGILNFRGYGRSTIGSLGSEAIEEDVAAVALELAKKGHGVVALGASRGGGAVLRAVSADPSRYLGIVTWSTVLVDASIAGSLGNIRKLFIVSAKEMMHDQTVFVYQHAPDPKILKEIPGTRHAQNIWNGPDRELIESQVFEFLKTIPIRPEASL